MSQKIYTDLDINGNVKSNSYKFNLPSSVSSHPNMLIPKIDGTRPIWYDNSSVANDLAFKSDVDNLQIGGRNLILNSDSNDTILLYGVTATYENIVDNQLPSKQYFKFTNVVRTIGNYVFYIPTATVGKFSQSLIGKKIQISFYIRSNNSQKLVFERDGSQNFMIDSTWKKVRFNAVINDGNLHFLLEGSGLTSFDISSVKIEFGDVATDWTPAPEDKQDRLQDVTGYIGVGKTDASATEKLDVNGNIKATKFIKDGGTNAQFLMADGSVNSNTYSVTTHTHTFASLTSKPTTLAGYGITDSVNRSEYKNFGEIQFGTGADWTTTDFINHLTSIGFFNQSHSIARGSWGYAGNSNIVDVFGGIELAGCIVESFSNTTNKTIRITCPTTSTTTSAGRVFVYNDQNNGTYSPGWREEITTNSPSVSNWNAAYGWGNHATQGYLTSATLPAPLTSFSTSAWAGTGGYPGYSFAGGNSRFGFSSSGGTVDVYADGNFYATDNLYRVWHAGDFSSTNISNWNTAYGWGNHASAGYATQSWVQSQGYITGVTNISGYSGTLIAEDNRTIAPSELAARMMKFGFTSWNNNNTSPYADFIHLRSYQDDSGGSDNLVMFRKDAIGMRIYQQPFGSSTAYSSYKDVAFTDSSITGNAATATKLQTARTIGGVSFDGTANINLPGVNAAGNQSTTGNAATATTLQTARTLTIGATGKTFNGSANVAWTLAEIGAQASLVTSTTATGVTNVVTDNTNTFLNITQNGASPGSSTQITGAGSVTVSSDTAGKLTITGTAYSLPIASASVLGGVKIGSGISIDGDGVISANTFTPGTTNRLSKFSGSNLADSIIYDNGTNVGIGTTTTPSTTLDVNGWATFLDSSGNRLIIWDGNDNTPTIGAYNLLTLQSPTIRFYATDVTDLDNNSIYLKLKTITGNTTLNNTYHNKIVRITASCIITIPNNLRTDFNCTFEVIGAYTAQFVDGSGATTSAPFGRYLKTDLTAMFYCTGTASNYRLNGSLTTS